MYPIPYQTPPPRPVDPFTGYYYSDKSRTTAVLLQCLPGMFSIGGIGRLYSGHAGLGTAQLILGIILWICAICFFYLILPPLLLIAAAVWYVIDGALIKTDGAGHPLTP